MNFKKMDINDIIAWCKENNQVAWLQAKAKEKVTVERYSKRIKVWDEEKGKYVYKADKNSPKTTVKQPITFVQIKYDFCKKFMPDILPEAKEKAPTMFDLIAKL